MSGIIWKIGQKVWAIVSDETKEIFVVLVTPKPFSGAMVAYLPKHLTAGIPLSPGMCLECSLRKKLANGAWLVDPIPETPVSILYLQRARREFLQMQRDRGQQQSSQ